MKASGRALTADRGFSSRLVKSQLFLALRRPRTHLLPHQWTVARVGDQDLLLNNRRAHRNAALAALICALHLAPSFSDAFLCNRVPEGHMWV